MNRDILLKHINEHVRKITENKTYLSQKDIDKLNDIEDMLDEISVIGIR